jgi:hypothetical protein
LSSCSLSKNLGIKIYKTIFLPVVSYGCETLTLRKDHEWRVFDNRMLSGIFGPKREEGAVVWRRMHNEELHNLYTSPIIITVITSKRMRLAGHVACDTKFWFKNLKGRDHLEDLDIDRMISE